VGREGQTTVLWGRSRDGRHLRSRPTLEDHLQPRTEDCRRADACLVEDRQAYAIPADGVLLIRPDDLDVWRQEEPRREGEIVERLEAPPIAQERLGSDNRELEPRVVDAAVEVPMPNWSSPRPGSRPFPPTPTL
jgi:hypothetical protein